MKTQVLVCAVATLVSVGIATTARAAPVLEFMITATTGFAGADVVAGWSFTTTQAVTVVALDAFEAYGDGTAGAVRLYTAGGTILAIAQVTNSDPLEGSPIPFYSHAIAPVTLAPNTIYYIAEDLGVPTLLDRSTGLLTIDPAIIYDGAVSAYGQGNDPTGDVHGQADDPGYFGPDFDIAAIAVPESASLTLFTAALAGLGLVRRRKARRTVAHPDRLRHPREIYRTSFVLH